MLQNQHQDKQEKDNDKENELPAQSKHKICPLYIPSNQQIGPSKKECNLGLNRSQNTK